MANLRDFIKGAWENRDPNKTYMKLLRDRGKVWRSRGSFPPSGHKQAAPNPLAGLRDMWTAADLIRQKVTGEDELAQPESPTYRESSSPQERGAEFPIMQVPLAQLAS